MKFKELNEGQVVDMTSHLHKKMDKEFDDKENKIEYAKDSIDDAVESIIDMLGNQIKNREEAEQIIVDHLNEIVMYFDLKNK